MRKALDEQWREIRFQADMLWCNIHIFVLTAVARLLGAHLGETRDLQNFGFLVLARRLPDGDRQIATYLRPGAPTDLYFPAPAQPELMHVDPVRIRGVCWSCNAGRIADLAAARWRLCRA